MMGSFGFSVFLSSILLFQIQPILSKYILPWFGGTSGVWSACLLYFQVMLTGGYSYANWLTKRLTLKGQGWLHLSLLGLSVLLLGITTLIWKSPILPDSAWRPQDLDHSLGQAIKILFVAIGLPFFLLSANSPLIQSWFVKQFPDQSPYNLYAISNLGSLLGLIAYPVIFEPSFSLRSQSLIWTVFYGIFILITGYHASRMIIGEKLQVTKSNVTSGFQNYAPLKFGQVAIWVSLTALASIFLLSTTNRITQEVAAIPFLWVLPLAIYLLSFILVFAGERFYNRWLYLFFLFISTFGYLWFIIASPTNFLVQLCIYSVLLFVCTMICHGEVYRLRPAPQYLTNFYLMLSIGGALGGIAVNFIFPHIFKGFWEFQGVLGMVWGMMFRFVITTTNRINFTLHRLIITLVGIMVCLVFGHVYIQAYSYSQDTVLSDRNFFGILSVKEKYPEDPENHYFVLTHGITTHGYQFTAPDKRYLPTAYYVEKSGIGIGLTYYPARSRPLNVGVIGLGVGVLAAYGKTEDQFKFYEINPKVVEIASSKYFSYLKDSPANIEIILGDGRISLERELIQKGSNDFDILVLDAFNSDSIPTHLLTKEAFDLYLKHLKPEGILALHISNQYLNLRPVVWQLADVQGLKGLAFYNTSEDLRSKPSLWVLLTNNLEFLQNQNVIRLSLPVEPEDEIPGLRLWTDEYCNLFQILIK